MTDRRMLMMSLAVLIGLSFTTSAPAREQTLPVKIPVTVNADNLDYDRTNDVYTATGHVKIEQENIKLEAEKVVLNNKTGEALAEGKVYLQDQDDVVHADKLRVNLNTGNGVVYRGDLFMKKDNYHLSGDVIERRSETVYRVEHGTFTTCDEKDWFIRADEMNIDMARYATGNGVSLNMGGVPVFYTPYFLFPVRRQTGLLIPEPGTSSKDGFFIQNAFFWAISDNTDMTLYSDYRERTGHGTGVEYRYNNSRESAGQAYAKVWDLYNSGENRWEFRFQHREEFAEDLSARADINLVSDEHYYSDLDKSLEMRSMTYIDSNAFFVERWDTASLYLLSQYSTDLTTTNGATVQKLPELRYTIYEEQLAGPFHLNFEGSATNFSKETEDGVRRADFNPQLSAAFGHGGLSFVPRAGVRATFYDRSASSVEPTERKYAYAAMDINARVSQVFRQDGDAGIGRVRHSIEPTLSYTYIPYIDQGDIPKLDSVDSVSAQNVMSYSVTNRLTAHYKESKDAKEYSTFDLMVFKLSQSYDLNLATSSTSTAHSRSDITGELYIKTPKRYTLSATATYDTYNRLLSSHSIGATLTTDAVTLNLTEQFLYDPATYYLIGGGALKLGKWDLSAEMWRDIENKKTTQEEYKAHYASQCWGIGFSHVVKPGETQWKVLVDLKGFGGNK